MAIKVNKRVVITDDRGVEAASLQVQDLVYPDTKGAKDTVLTCDGSNNLLFAPVPTQVSLTEGDGITLTEASGDYTVSAKIGRGLTIDDDKAIAITLSDTLEFEGTVNLTTATVVDTASANDGDTYFNIGDGTVSTEWVAISDLDAGDLVEPRSSVTWDSGDSEFKYLPAAKAVELWSTSSGKLYPTSTSSDVLVGGANTTDAKIQLNADGSATFAGNVQVGTWTNGTNSTQEGAYIYNSGAITVSRIDGANDILKGHTQGAVTSTISADGSATFKDRVTVGDPVTNTGYAVVAKNNGGGGNATFYGINFGGGRLLDLRSNDTDVKVIFENNGSATFAGPITVDAGQPNENSTYGPGYLIQNRSAGTRNLWTGQLSGVETSTILADGSATFAGTITAAKSAITHIDMSIYTPVVDKS